MPTTNFASDQEYLHALAVLLKQEYRAIDDAGFSLQVDSPDTPMMRNPQLWDVPGSEDRRYLSMRLEALNFALAGLPQERVRFHCDGARKQLPVFAGFAAACAP